MPFASRADLLARSNARRLIQLAVPADVAMPPEASLRIAIAGGDLSGYTVDEQAAIALALDAIDKALADADALLLSYGLPQALQTTLVARLSSTVAMYYLQGSERMTDDVAKAYQGVIDILKNHATGVIDLVPADTGGAVVSSDTVQFESASRRYGGSPAVLEDGQP